MATTDTSKPSKEQSDRKDDTRTTMGMMNAFWDTAVQTQRNWFDLWARPFASTPSFDILREQWHKLSTQWLDCTERTSSLGGSCLNDQVKLAREFTDRSFEVAGAPEKREPREILPDLSRQWLDTMRRSTERTFQFGTDTLKAWEEFGRQSTETLARVPAGTR